MAMSGLNGGMSEEISRERERESVGLCLDWTGIYRSRKVQYRGALVSLWG